MMLVGEWNPATDNTGPKSKGEVGSTHLAKLATQMDTIWPIFLCVQHGSSSWVYLWVYPSIFAGWTMSVCEIMHSAKHMVNQT